MRFIVRQIAAELTVARMLSCRASDSISDLRRPRSAEQREQCCCRRLLLEMAVTARTADAVTDFGGAGFNHAFAPGADDRRLLGGGARSFHLIIRQHLGW